MAHPAANMGKALASKWPDAIENLADASAPLKRVEEERMPGAIPEEVDPSGFEANLDECSVLLQEIVGYLRATALYAGADVASRRYRHPKPNSGWGITYYARGHRFCELHPKRDADHVWGFISQADPAAMGADGFQLSRQEGWFQVRNMGEAVRFAKWIVWAHDRVAG
jgi:hypothetical protein